MPEESIIEKIKLEPVEEEFCDIFIEDEKIIIPELMKYENDGYLDLKNEDCLLNEAAIKIEENSVKICVKKLPYNKEKVTKPKRYRRKQYKCNTCEELFQKQSLLNDHVFKQHRNNKDALKQVEHKILMCNTCSYKSLQRKNLNRHLKIHIKTETKKSSSDGNSNYFYCFHCSYFTNTKHSLAKHLRLHNSYSRLPHCCKVFKVAVRNLTKKIVWMPISSKITGPTSN
ncbi:RE1-silencing transcription factor-like isoform X2 [Sitophilus oryzae]|uniref:RE1-silencing transcription factor-like isoform X2 n=1 Tax=Sitophilus oryzae TaxID=7048 RepID=A0A6J2YPR6_SITOR|nr:RE1-silencing transcription factor-like isoform X2 [Sitophilus oryzae]